ncbi:MAG: transcriptional repressor NrdR [Candidatus Moranbacteria bacterium]|nr:transcriptional repressor NrdR [Candidatus Moranbacteria bacterium]
MKTLKHTFTCSESAWGELDNCPLGAVKIEYTPILVVKANGNRQIFDGMKIKNGIVKACEKRPVPIAKIDKLVSEIEKQITNSLAQEISSKKIGEMVMDGLKHLDEVAFVRFASVHRQFKDINTLREEIEKLIGSKLKDEL